MDSAAGQVDGADAVAVADHEVGLIEQVTYLVEPTPGAGVHAGVDQAHVPVVVIGPLVEARTHAIGHVDREVRNVLGVAEEVLLDVPGLVAETEHELAEPVGAVRFHDVPEHRHAANFHHWFGA